MTDVPSTEPNASPATGLRRRAALIRAAAADLYEAADGDLDRDVPTCPEWTLGDLAWHLGEVHWSWGTIVADGVTERPADRELPDRPDDEALLDWCRAQTERLAHALEQADPEDPAWNWSGRQQTVGWIARRMTQETLVHRWDAQRAMGESGEEPPVELAVEGLEELLTTFLPASGPYEGRPGALRLRATDAGRSWDVDLFPPVPTVHDDADRMVDLVVEGAAAELLLALWGRATAAGLVFDGPAEPFESLREHLDTE